MNFAKEIITSKTNSLVLQAGKLCEKKFRDVEKKFRFDGIKLFTEAVSSDVEIETVVLSESAVDKFSSSIENALENGEKFDVKVLSDSVFDKISEEKSPEGIICIAKHIDKLHKIATINNRDEKNCDFSWDFGDDKIFAVESVRDPGNLGTIIRTCNAFGVDTLILSSDCADIYNSKTVRAAMGALFRQKILRVDNLPEILKFISKSGRTTYAATLGEKAVLLGKEPLLKTDCVVVGNEGHGLSPETVKACDKNILIPMQPCAESLNAAVASSVIMWEQFK